MYDIAWIEVAARSKQLHVDIDDEHLDIIISSQDRSGPEMKENNIIIHQE